MIQNLFFVLWFFLPAGLANAAPVFAAKVPVLSSFSYPLDGYMKFDGKPILGDHKTIRGLLSGIVVGVFTALIELFFYSRFPFIRKSLPISYNLVSSLLLGGLLGLGALTGDAVKSFFKRRVHIASGKSWFFFDQLDYIIGGIILTFPIVRLTMSQYMLLIIVWFLLHPIATGIGFLLKLKSSPL